MTERDELLADLQDLERNRDRLRDAVPVSEQSRARAADCLAAYERHIAATRQRIEWLRETDDGFTIEDRL